LFQKAQLQLITDLPPDLVPVMADPPYLQRLLAIVLENARKYTPAGGMVLLKLKIADDRALFEVSDTGIGIPAEDLERIFDRFCRGSNIQQTHSNGSGLGLALGAWIAECHQAVIHVESSVGAGSTFSWLLPLSGEDVEDKPAETGHEERLLSSVRV
jgi:signal transduction histidine kinase